MPIVEIRETIQGVIQMDPEGRGYMTRRINIPEGLRSEILNLDMSNDNVDTLSVTTNDLSGHQVYLSPYPVQLTNQSITLSPTVSLPNCGPMAGEETVLYKQTEVTTLKQDDFAAGGINKVWREQYPSPESSAVPTNKFYSSHVYLTVLLWNSPEAFINVKFSLFLKVKQTKVGVIESTMGRYAEFLNAQARLLSRTAVNIDLNLVAGNTFPMWKQGGIRPELMISGANALRYFNRVASNANQEMTTQNALQTAYQDATGMVAFDGAFGSPANNLPEWITLMDVSGVTSGLIRPYPPPLKFNDNGNTEMF